MLRDEVFAELGITVLPGARAALGWTQDKLTPVLVGELDAHYGLGMGVS
jgi:hypothetical protein